MQIKYVTLTGADDSVSIDDLVEISDNYPFVEWGILFSQSKSGVPRYPSQEWVEFLSCQRTEGMNLSAHLCGKWVEDALDGEITFLRDESIQSTFQRIQLNCNKNRLDRVFSSDEVWKAFKPVSISLILGGSWQGHHHWSSLLLLNEVSPLFDASGGGGKSPSFWPELLSTEDKTLFCGYAGGLGPENILEELKRIEAVVGDNEIWIDMESKLRDRKDKFDLEKCKEVLRRVKEWQDDRIQENGIL